VSYRELNNYVNMLAQEWTRGGVKAHSVVAGIGKNGIDLIAAYFATMKCGAAFTMLNWAHTPGELRYQLDHATPALVVAREAFLGPVSRLVDNDSPLSLVSLDRALAASSDESFDELDTTIEEHWTAAIVYTSGTESHPKGVELTHRNFMIATTPAWSYEGYLRSSDRFLLLAPIHTMAGIGTVTNAMSMGATLVVLDTTDAEVVLTTIESERITNMSQTPTFYRRMVESVRFAQTDLSSLEQCHTYGGLNQVGVFEALVAKVPGLWWATYWGQSELSQLGSIGWFRSLSDIPGGDLRWIGVPTPHLEVRVVDDEFNDVEVGEMVVRSPAVMKGYRDNPERTAETLRGGWLHTGDIVRRDAEMNLFFYDRKKDVIKTGGMNVSSLEVEQVILEVDGVLEVAVFGCTDEVWSEAVVACVVCRPGAIVDASTVIAHCKSRLSGYKAPKEVHFAESLPKDLQGKIRKRLLRDEYDVVR
jgi:acyl-CoA synthetase (AMP-forming)/AMP-acid ligase II